MINKKDLKNWMSEGDRQRSIEAIKTYWQAYQDQMDDDAQFEAEQEALKDDVYDKLANCYAIVREMITDELTSDVSPTNWAKIEGIATAMKDLAHYLATDDWTNALVEINNYV